MAEPLPAMGQPNYRNGFTLTPQPHVLELPLHWRKPQTIFVNSMSDLFHQDIALVIRVDGAWRCGDRLRAAA
jgi:protein gp37